MARRARRRLGDEEERHDDDRRYGAAARGHGNGGVPAGGGAGDGLPAVGPLGPGGAHVGHRALHGGRRVRRRDVPDVRVAPGRGRPLAASGGGVPVAGRRLWVLVPGDGPRHLRRRLRPGDGSHGVRGRPGQSSASPAHQRRPDHRRAGRRGADPERAFEPQRRGRRRSVGRRGPLPGRSALEQPDGRLRVADPLGQVRAGAGEQPPAGGRGDVSGRSRADLAQRRFTALRHVRRAREPRASRRAGRQRAGAPPAGRQPAVPRVGLRNGQLLRGGLRPGPPRGAAAVRGDRGASPS